MGRTHNSVVQVREIKLWPPPPICQSVLVMFTQFWSPQCLDSWPPDSEGEEAQQQQGLSGETPDTEVGLN